MARYTVIADIGEEILKRLRSGMVPSIIKNPDMIGLANPIKKPDYALTLFLYDIQPMDISAARTQMGMETVRGLPICLKYMIAANSNADMDMQAIEEQRILARAIQVLGNQPVIHPGNNFLGENDLPVGISLEPLTLDDKNKVWSTMGAMWTSVFYQVSPVFIDQDTGIKVPRVKNT